MLYTKSDSLLECSGTANINEGSHTFTCHTHTHPFNSLFSGTTQVSRYQKGRTNLDFTEARDSEWQWHQLGCMQVCTSLQTDNHARTPPLKFFTGRMPFLPPNQQRQSTEGTFTCHSHIYPHPRMQSIITLSLILIHSHAAKVERLSR